MSAIMGKDLLKNIRLILSKEESLRKEGEKWIHSYYDQMDISSIKELFEILSKNKENTTNKYISIIIDKFINEKIKNDNYITFLNYLENNISNILNILLDIENDLSIAKLLIINLCKFITNFKNDNNKNLVDKIYNFLFNFYITNKKKENNEVGLRALFIIYKFIKYLSQNMFLIKTYTNVLNNFFIEIIKDYEIINNKFLENLNISCDYSILYLKLINYGLIFINLDSKEYIFEISNNLLVRIFQNISNLKNDSKLNEKIFKIILNIIKLFNNYIIIEGKSLLKCFNYEDSKVNTELLSLNDIKKMAEFFYYLISENIFNKIIELISNTNFNEVKLIKYIFDFFINLLDITTITKENEFSKQIIQYVNDLNIYLINIYWTEEKIYGIIYFIIKKVFIFKSKEINLGLENNEEFYLWFTGLNTDFDLRGKAGKLCNDLFDTFQKTKNIVFEQFEKDLVNLTQKENKYINNNNNLNGDELNYKCGLLTLFYYINTYFYEKIRKKEIKSNFIKTCLIDQININIINKKNSEIFSSFLILEILSKLIFNLENFDFRIQSFMNIINLFLDTNYNNNLLNFACLNFLNEYTDEILTSKIEIPNEILNKIIIKTSVLISHLKTSEVASKMIDIINNIINRIKNDKLTLDNNLVFSELKNLWFNERDYKNNINFKGIIKRNILKMIFILLQKFDLNNNNIKNENLDFIFNAIKFSINFKNKEFEFTNIEGYNLIFYFFDFFAKNKNSNDISNENIKINYIIQLLPTLDNILLDLNETYQYNLIPQLFLIENFISLSYIDTIANYIENNKTITKIIFIIKKYFKDYMFYTQYNQLIINFMEYIYFIIFNFSLISNEIKNEYNNFIYEFIIEHINNNEDNITLNSIQLANRLIFTNAYKNVIVNDFNEKITENLIRILLNNKNNNIELDYLQQIILKNTITNLKYIFSKVYTDSNSTLNLLNQALTYLNKEKEIKCKSLFLEKNDKNDHWLYFFNKIANNISFCNFTSKEDILRHKWIEKLQNFNQFYDINQEFLIKNEFLTKDMIITKNNI